MKKILLPTVLLVLAACNGWPHAPKLAEVTNKAEKYHTYTATPAKQTQTFVFDNRRFMVDVAPVDLHDAKLQPVGSAGGVAIYAAQGEHSPYTNLYTPAGGTKWRPVTPID